METKEAFECSGCGKCCALKVPITEQDFNRLLDWKNGNGIGNEAFASFFAVGRHKDYAGPIVHLSAPCPFIGEAGCQAYSFRPHACMLYPFAVAPADSKRYKNLVYSEKINGEKIGVFFHCTECPSFDPNVSYSARFFKRIIKIAIEHEQAMIAGTKAGQKWYADWRRENIDLQAAPK
jgi:Fe-S-cluster containining protein